MLFRSFMPLLFAEGAMLAGLIASQIFFNGASLPEFKVELFFLVIFFAGGTFAPVCMFVPLLIRTKGQGRREYGLLAGRYAQEFDAKWIRDPAKAADPGLMGSADIQSLADMANSYAVVQSMRLVPFGLEAITYLVFTTVAPILPLTLTMMPLEQIVDHLIKAML